jgi:hypothetical protein
MRGPVHLDFSRRLGDDASRSPASNAVTVAERYSGPQGPRFHTSLGPTKPRRTRVTTRIIRQRQRRWCIRDV